MHMLVATLSDACDSARSLERTAVKRVVARVVRGHKARTVHALFDECAAAWQFPWYFGENWDALEECLADLEWVQGDAHVLLVSNSQQLLDKESPQQLQCFLGILERVAGEWSLPKAGPAPRSPKPFHVVFQCTNEAASLLRARWSGIGASLNTLS